MIYKFSAEYKDGKLLFTDIYEKDNLEGVPVSEDRVGVIIVPHFKQIHFICKNLNVLNAFSSGMWEAMQIQKLSPEEYFKEYAEKLTDE